jgi:catechol 2,3-dioxygenase-like lactoylglutathione lyase family enzyme
MTEHLLQVTPFMHVPDIEHAVAFFRDLLGFEQIYRLGAYAYVRRGPCAFRLLQNQGDDGAPPGNRRFAYYIDVRDVDALYRELKPKLNQLPPGDVHGPADKLYHQRELLILAPDGNLLAFGSAIAT